jgi:hypothetical protein
MADNVTLPGTGEVIAADDVGSAKYQRVKLALGADGSAADAPGEGTYGMDVDVTRLPALVAGEAHVGEVGGKTILTTITFSLDTSAYAIGDVLADTQILTACLRVNDGTGILQSMTINDKDDQGFGFDVYILNANVSIGTENAAPSITDANADNILGSFPVLSGDFKDLGGCRHACIKNIGIPVKGASGTDDLYIALVVQGAGTYSASGITAIFGILCD